MKTTILMLLTFTTHLFGVLPPLWHDVSEIKAMLTDEGLSRVIGSEEAILEIKQWEKGWQIITTKQVIQVEVTTLPTTRPGPANFSFEFIPNQN